MSSPSPQRIGPAKPKLTGEDCTRWEIVRAIHRHAAEQWMKRVLDGTRTPLLETTNDKHTAVLDANGRRMIRSEALTKRLRGIRDVVQSEVKGSYGLTTEGICYLIYRTNDSQVVEPLYVGIARTRGKKKSLSTLFASGWLRFSDAFGSRGHIGNLNDYIFANKTTYKDWCDELFVSTNPPKLRTPVFVDVEVWNSKSPSVLSELGHTPLFVEEAIRIWLLILQNHAPKLLNKEANFQWRN